MNIIYQILFIIFQYLNYQNNRRLKYDKRRRN